MYDHHHDVPLQVLGWCAILQVAGMVVEFFGGYHTHSLSLTSDAWHMAADVAPVTLTLLIRMLIQRGRRLGRMGGFQTKVVATGVFNALTLIFAGVIALIQSASVIVYNERVVISGLAMSIAAAGLGINVLCYRLTTKHSRAVGHVDSRFDIRALSGHMLMDGVSSGVAILCLLLNRALGNTIWDTLGGMLLGWGMIAYGLILLITEFLRRIES